MTYRTNTCLQVLLLCIALCLFSSWSKSTTLPTTSSPLGATPAQTIDSLALVSLYNNTNGPFWRDRWDLSEPVCDWFGITVDTEGYVTEIHLNNNSLNGTLPSDIGNFARLEYLQLDHNNLFNDIPDEIGNLATLTILFLDDNNFSGSIPSSFGNLNSLQTLYIDNNNLTGPVPADFVNLTNLSAFDFFRNHIDSLPDLSSLNLQWNRFNIYSNNLSFDDILPNLGVALNDKYVPQDSVFTKSTEVVATGTYYEIDLGIDASVSDNVYQWYKNGLPYGPTTNSNTLVFPAINWSDAGGYSCVITNPGAPLLTLYSRTRTLQVVCGTSTLQINETLCSGSERIINSITYNESNPSGTQTLNGQDRYGCDSIIQVNFLFEDATIGNVSPTLCQGDSLRVNGQVFNQTNPTGSVRLTAASVNGCDSIVQVNLNFHPVSNSNFIGTFCEGRSFLINGTTYDKDHPNGSETLIGASSQGCDSTINVNLNFTPPPSGTLNQMLCTDDFLIINGTRYDASNPSGSERILNGATNGCDSIVSINLSFANAVTNLVNPTLCPGESIWVQGVQYNEGRPNGTEVFSNGSAAGCDSLVQIDLSFHAPALTIINRQLCQGQSLEVGSSFFDKDNPRGTVTLPAASQNGCDSIVQVELTFGNSITTSLRPTLCADESILVNGTTYNQSNPAGTEMLTTSSGCDSLVDVQLAFYPDARGLENRSICPNDFLMVNGQRYDASRPNGTEMLPNASVNGCDSTVQIELSFFPNSVGLESRLFCQDDFLIVNGQRYDASRPNGTEVLPNASANGCDSTIQVQLDFHPVARGIENRMICQDDFLIVNGQRYDASRPNGTEVLSNASVNGCDSTIQIQLNFHPTSSGVENSQLCSGDFLIVNGQRYDESNPSGTELLENASVNGCDSIVEVQLAFVGSIMTSLEPTLCANESIVVNGTTYNQAKPSGTESLSSTNGCDSIIQVQLAFFPAAIGQENSTICPNGALLINGERYDASRPSGTEILTGASANGCDSTVQIQLNFSTPVPGRLEQTLCPGETLDFNGSTYDESNYIGTEILAGAGQNGCDSIVEVELFYQQMVAGNLNLTLCTGSNLVINGTTYDESNPTGTEVLIGGSALGCDSTVIIDLAFREATYETINRELCKGASLEVGNETFDENNPTGQVVFANGAKFGCDSIVEVQLSFVPEIEYLLTPVLCKGESLIVNGQTYDEANPNGQELLRNASAKGCDSLVLIDLSFQEEAVGLLTSSLCPGEEFVINGTAYNQSNPNGIERFPAAGQNGCDSLVQIELSFLPTAVHDLTTAICEDGELIINGTSYNRNRPSGTEVLSGQAANGCDSVINIQLSFREASLGEFETTICENDNFILNGIVFDKDNTSAQVLLENANQWGCDSLVNVRVEIQALPEFDWTPTICANDQIEVHGEFFDRNKPTGSVLVPSANPQLCDSLVHVQLAFYPEAVSDLEARICEGEVYQLHDSDFERAGAYEVVLPNASQNGCDSTIHLLLEVENPFVMGEANAGLDQNSCETEALLESELANGLSGQWSSSDPNLTFSHPTASESVISGLQAGTNVVFWQVSTDLCVDFDTDTLYIERLQAPVAEDDFYDFDAQTNGRSLQLEVSDNDYSVNGAVSINKLTQPGLGEVRKNGDKQLLFIAPAQHNGPLHFTYELCLDACPDLCDTATVQINLQMAPDQVDPFADIPNGITPNEDGLNDAFVIPYVEQFPTKYPNRELVVFNRWGDVLFQQKGYLNDWKGTDAKGQPLTEGTYYFVFRLDFSDGLIYKGDVTIVR